MRDTHTIADWRTYTCTWCGQAFKRAARVGRKSEFCSDGCRSSFWHAVSRGTAAPGSARQRNSRKIPAISSASTGHFRSRGFDLTRVEPRIRARIIESELIRGPEREVISPDDVHAFVVGRKVRW